MDGQLQHGIFAEVKRKVHEENLSAIQCSEQAYNYLRRAMGQDEWHEAHGYSQLWMGYAKAYTREVHRKLEGTSHMPKTFITPKAQGGYIG